MSDVIQPDLSLYREFDRNIPGAFYRYVIYPDGRTRFAHMSESYAILTGFPVAQVMSHENWIPQAIYADDLPSLQQAIMQSAQTMGLVEWEGRGLKADGNIFWLRVVARPQQASDGAIMWDGFFVDITESMRAQQAERQSAEQEALIREQSELLAELSTPLIPLTEGVLVMPLIGTITTRRAQQVMETLLEGIVQHQAETVLLDITGVKTVDTSVANALIQAARAVSLIGAKLVLTGIQPRIAQTLVQLGVNLGDVVTYSTLQAGINSILAAQHVLESQPKQVRSDLHSRAG